MSGILFLFTLQSLAGSLQGRNTYREIPVVITGNVFEKIQLSSFFFPVLLTYKLLL